MPRNHRALTVPRALALAAPLLALAGCAQPTPYQPETDGRGYAQQALEENRYRVTFSGNTVTSREAVENALLYRAAEITVERGFDHFVVVDRDTEKHTTYHGMPTAFDGPYGFHRHDPLFYRSPYPFTDLGSSTLWPRDRYSAVANIVMRPGPKPEDDPDAYDARAVMDRLGSAVKTAP